MSSGHGSASGPDLAAGVPAHAVVEGQLFAGHVGDDAVILTRLDGRCFAIGGLCTHYSAALSDGLVVNGTVRCPWHHAAFDLRTGKCARPPALNDLPRWTVEESNGTVRVIDKIEPGSLVSSPNAAGQKGQPASVVLVGAGAAGVVAAQTLRAEGYGGLITMLDGEREPVVDRPNLSKDYLAGTAPEDWMPLRPPGFFDQLGVRTVFESPVISIDVQNHLVRCANGDTHQYGALLLATGATPTRLPLQGGPTLPVFYLRTIDDSRAIIRALGDGKRAVVIGASFIGLEVAGALRNRQVEVHVVAPEPRPLERVMGAQLGDFVRKLHESNGVNFHLGTKPVRIEGSTVHLESGEQLPADLVVIGVGVRPNLALAEAAGCKMDRGVVVDEHLQTSIPGIFAAGDIARWPDPHSGEAIRVEHWVVAERQGKTAARNMLGARERFEAVPFFWSAHYDVTIAYVGHAEAWDSIDVDGDIDARDCAVTFKRGGRTLAVATIGRDLTSLQSELRLENERA
jgi:apoptosis-inducing factor 3